MQRRLTNAFTIFVVLIGLAFRAQEAEASLSEGVLEGFDELQGYIVHLPADLLSSGRRQSLLAKLRTAEANYREGRPCPSARNVEAFLHETRRSPPRQVMLDLHDRALFLLDTLLSSLPEDETCRSNPPEVDCLEDAPWPDLVARELTADPPTPYEGDEARLALEVVNRGGVAASSVAVSFARDGEEFGRELVSVAPCSSTTVQEVWPGSATSPNRIEARIDPDGFLPEGTKTNNVASLELLGLVEATRPWEPPDLVNERLTLDPDRAMAGEPIALTAEISNRTSDVEESTVVLHDIVVRFLVDGVAVDAVRVEELLPGETRTVTGEWTSGEPGRHYVSAIAELAAGEVESDPTDNNVSEVIHLGGATETLPDLLIEELSFDPAMPSAGDTLTVRASIRNIGWGAAENVPVEFHTDVRDDVPAPATSPGRRPATSFFPARSFRP